MWQHIVNKNVTKYQSNIEKHRNWITEHRVDISYSSRYAAMEDTFVKIANGEGGGDYKEVIFKMPKIEQVLLNSFMEARNNSLLFAKTTMDENGKCTVSETTTDKDSSGATTGESTKETQVSQSDFCAQNPGSSVCKSPGLGREEGEGEDDKKSSFSGSCSSNFNCEGDSVQ